MRIISPFRDDYDPWIRASVPPVGRSPVWTRTPVVHGTIRSDELGDLAVWTMPLDHHQTMGPMCLWLELTPADPDPLPRALSESLLMMQGWLVCNGLATPWWFFDDVPWAPLISGHGPPTAMTRIMGRHHEPIAGASTSSSLSAAVAEVLRFDGHRTHTLTPAAAARPRDVFLWAETDTHRARRRSAVTAAAKRRWDELHVRFQSPLLAIVPTRRDRQTIVIANPCLRPLGAMKVWAPAQIAQEVLACADRLLLPPDPATIVPSESVRLVKHGFDPRWSFRHPPRSDADPHGRGRRG